MKKFASLVSSFISNYYQPRYLFLFTFLFFVVIVYINSTYTFVGRGDYANYSNVARSLVNGKGFQVDYIAWHYLLYPEVSHPEDMWPLLQPVWIAFSYLIFGITPFAARLPNAVFLATLVLLTYFIGSKIFDRKIAFWGAVLTGLNTELIRYSTDWITSDVALAVFSLTLFYLGYLNIIDSQKRKLRPSRLFWFGLIGGLAALQKPMGILLPSVYIPFYLYHYRKHLRSFIKPMVWFSVGLLIPLGPFFLRNWLLFRTLFLPIEHYLGYQIKYFPYETIFSIQYGNPPSLKTWLDYGLGNFLRVNWQYFRYAVDTFIYRDLLMPYTVIVFSLLKLRNLSTKQRFFIYPLILLFALMSFLMATYWHYESRYYSMLIPIFNLLAIGFVFELFHKITWRNSLLIATFAFITLLPSVKTIFEGVKQKPTDPSLTAYTWIKYNTPPEAVVMTLTPWELNFHSERRAVVIPNNSKEEILWVAKKYGADYLEIEFLKEIKREALKNQYLGRESAEFKPIYQDPENVFIYKINWDKIQLDPNTKPDWF